VVFDHSVHVRTASGRIGLVAVGEGDAVSGTEGATRKLLDFHNLEFGFGDVSALNNDFVESTVGKKGERHSIDRVEKF
jgi:hypothetical protein